MTRMAHEMPKMAREHHKFRPFLSAAGRRKQVGAIAPVSTVMRRRGREAFGLTRGRRVSQLATPRRERPGET